MTAEAARASGSRGDRERSPQATAFAPPSGHHRSARSGGDPLEIVHLPPLMARTEGSAQIVIALVDGPVRLDHPDLAQGGIKDVTGTPETCATPDSAACVHGTFSAGILCARRGSAAPAICPSCTVLVRPLFKEAPSSRLLPSATPEELAQSILDAVRAGAHVVNISSAMTSSSIRLERELQDSLDYALRTDAIVVAAAGNDGALASSVITRHPAVIPVVGYHSDGRLLSASNLSASTGRRGVGGPAVGIRSLDARGGSHVLSGTSFAAAFVTGAIGLLWSEFPEATATDIRTALAHGRPMKATLVPPLLNASAARGALARLVEREEMT